MADDVRQKFTDYERDTETNLDYAQARYYASAQGRFTSTDAGPVTITNPHSLNRYTYVLNNPVNLTDPTGLVPNAESAGGDLFTTHQDCSFIGGGCGEPTDIPDAEAAYAGRVKDTFDAAAANRAAQSGDMDTFWYYVNNNENLNVNEPQESRTKSKPAPKQRLTFTTVRGGPHSADWRIRWKLARRSKQGGWIVQEIMERDNSGNVVTHYWEAWQVRRNSKYTIYHGSFTHDDEFR